MQARDLRAIAERAATRDYLRARVTTIYGLDEYGVTVPGRTHEARVRTLSRSWHQVGDTVILASVNGDPQLLVILDAVGVTGGSASPYPPLPPVAGALWPTRAHDLGRAYDHDQFIPASMVLDSTWTSTLGDRGISGTVYLRATQDRWVTRTDVSYTSTVRAITLDAMTTSWEYAMGYIPIIEPAMLIAGDALYLYGAYTIAGVRRIGLVSLHVTDGSLRWGYESATRMRPIAYYPGGSILCHGVSGGVAAIYEMDATTGSVIATSTAASLLGAGWQIELDDPQGVARDVMLDGGLLVECTSSKSSRIVLLDAGGTARWVLSPPATTPLYYYSTRVVRATGSAVVERIGTSLYGRTLDAYHVTAAGVMGALVSVSPASTSLLWASTYYPPPPVDQYRFYVGSQHSIRSTFAAHGGRVLQIVRQIPSIFVGLDVFATPQAVITAGGMGYTTVRLLGDDLSEIWSESITIPDRATQYRYTYTPEAVAILADQGIPVPPPFWSIRSDLQDFAPDLYILTLSESPRDYDAALSPDPLQTYSTGERAVSNDVELECMTIVGGSSTLLLTRRQGVSGSTIRSWLITDDGISVYGVLPEWPVGDAIPYAGAVYTGIRRYTVT